jgi:Uma2 family endonuclease
VRLPKLGFILATGTLIVAIANRISEPEYRELALGESDHRWELWDGFPWEKPLMSMKHDDVTSYLGVILANQLGRREFRVNINGARARLSERTCYIPDVVVIPAAYKRPFEDDPRAFNAFAQPLPLVVEVWSPSTGDYDVMTKLRGYRERGDEEIWFVHPYERTLTVWRRQPDGNYVVETYRGGRAAVSPLPGVVADLDELLD